MGQWANRSVAFGAVTIGMFAAGALCGPAEATEGYFQPGYSAIQKGLAGAGSADPTDPMTIAVNPAGLTEVGRQIEIGFSLFAPYRGYTASGGPGFVAPGSVDSGWDQFLIPNLAYSQPIDEVSAWGIAVYGNGGMNTTYAGDIANPACGGGTGVFCGGKSGVNLNQMFVSASYARKIGNVSVGIAPIFALQMFSASGLSAFSAVSSSPTNLTNNGIDYSYGGGVRAGAIWSVAPSFRVSLAGSTPMWMTKFDSYAGLFEDQGSFNIPATISAGLAWDAMPNLTLMADYKHIFYSGVAAVSNSSQFTGTPFGADGGPGFGWSDVDVFSIGLEWDATPDWTLRAGYSYNNNPVDGDDVTLNILAPGIVTSHISAGLTRKFGENAALDFAAMYVPEQTVSGIERTPAGPNPGRNIELNMHQFDFTLGFRYLF